MRVDRPTPAAPNATINAIVQQIYRDTLFIVSSEIRERAGLLAVNAKDVTRMEGRSKLRQGSAYVQQRVRERDAHPAKLGRERSLAALASVRSSAAAVADTVPMEEVGFR